MNKTTCSSRTPPSTRPTATLLLSSPVLLASMFVLILTPISLISAGEGPGRNSSESEGIVEAVGVHGGLAVFIEGNGTLEAKLAERNGFLVHGLVTTKKRLVAMRKRLASLKCYGKRLSIEQ